MGNAYSPRAIHGTALDTPLKPGDSYLTDIEFEIPAIARAKLLLVRSLGWQGHFLIGDENSPLHKKTWFQL